MSDRSSINMHSNNFPVKSNIDSYHIIHYKIQLLISPDFTQIKLIL